MDGSESPTSGATHRIHVPNPKTELKIAGRNQKKWVHSPCVLASRNGGWARQNAWRAHGGPTLPLRFLEQARKRGGGWGCWAPPNNRVWGTRDPTVWTPLWPMWICMHSLGRSLGMQKCVLCLLTLRPTGHAKEVDYAPYPQANGPRILCTVAPISRPRDHAEA